MNSQREIRQNLGTGFVIWESQQTSRMSAKSILYCSCFNKIILHYSPQLACQNPNILLSVLGSYQKATETIILWLATYSKHWELPVVVEKSLFLSQLLILAQTLAEKMSDASMTCQHKPTDLKRHNKKNFLSLLFFPYDL